MKNLFFLYFKNGIIQLIIVLLPTVPVFMFLVCKYKSTKILELFQSLKSLNRFIVY